MKPFSSAMVVAMVMAAQPAIAAVRSTSPETGKKYFWPNRCVILDVFVSDPPPFLTSDSVINASTKAASAWNPEKTGCGDIILKVSSNIGSGFPFGADRKNTVQFYKEFWGRRNPDPRLVVSHPPDAFALTTVSTLTATGEIIDTDVEINAVNFKWDDLVTNSRPGERVADLQNTLTHEFGHVLGLDHNCNDGTNYVDTTGARAPNCASASESIREATMYPRVDRSDVLRRDLASDDITGLCAAYPRNLVPDQTSDIDANGNRSCNGSRPIESDSGGCSVSRASDAAAPSWLVLVGAVFAFARRLRRRR